MAVGVRESAVSSARWWVMTITQEDLDNIVVPRDGVLPSQLPQISRRS
jgi:hypothetical protein